MPISISGISDVAMHKNGFYFFTRKPCIGQKKIRDQFCSKMNEDFKNNFYFKKKQWSTLFFTKNIHREVRAGATGNHEKNFLLKKNVFQYVPTTYQNLKKNLLWFQKYLGKTDYFFKIQHPVSFNRRPFGPMFIGTFFLILVSSIVWHYAMYFFLCHPVYRVVHRGWKHRKSHASFRLSKYLLPC